MSIDPNKVYTLAEAADHLRLTGRAVAKIAKANGLCMVHGRTILLTGADIEKIKDVLRCPPSEKAIRPKPTRVPLPGEAFAKALAQVTERSQKRFSKK